MQKKTIPKFYSFCCDNSSSSILCEKYGIKQFPTTIVFSPDGIAQTKLIGCQPNLIQGLIDAQINISKGQPKALPLKCICGEFYQEVENEENEDIFCYYCGNSDKSQGLFDSIMGQDNSRVFVCPQGHMRCLKCSFLGVNDPSQFKDHRAKSYMVTNKQNNVEDYSMEACKNEFVNHTIQSTAEQGQRCICRRLFKKVYKTRDYVNNIHVTTEEGQDKLRKMMEIMYNTDELTWTCVLCDRKKNHGQLHLACFLCPFVKQQKMNIQICIECAIGSDMLNKQLQEKITQIPTDYVCQSKHQVVRTRLSYNPNDMLFDCIGCKKSFYIFSERYYCKTCKTNTCLACSTKNLVNTNPPKCLRKCNENHKLITKQNNDNLRMCDGCRIVVRKQYFACPVGCNFDLCLKCAATPPGVNTTDHRMQHIDQEKLRKEMEAYQRGYYSGQQEQQQEEQEQEQGGQEFDWW